LSIELVNNFLTIPDIALPPPCGYLVCWTQMDKLQEILRLLGVSPKRQMDRYTYLLLVNYIKKSVRQGCFLPNWQCINI